MTFIWPNHRHHSVNFLKNTFAIISGRSIVLSFLVRVGYTVHAFSWSPHARRVLIRVAYGSYNARTLPEWTLGCFRLSVLRVLVHSLVDEKMEIKWLQTSTHTHTHTKHTCWNAHEITACFHHGPLQKRLGSGVIVQSNRNQQNMRNNRMYIDVPESKSVDVNVLLSQLLFYINIHIYIWTSTVLYMKWSRNGCWMSTCQHANMQHVHSATRPCWCALF